MYANSLFELAQEAGGPDKINEIADEFEQILETRPARMPSSGKLLTSPIVNSTLREKALSGIFRNQITDLMLRFLLVLNHKGRLGHIEAIGSAF